ncbi:aminotransferase class I/II-fold pyridoxal phosphate-dependent enzyme [Micrococcales bacterium 31B]|nr:aminotransferase class I/II-fold pyridoxal phosphate-dependent enzyme [Micrococcales bacterium 31B]
MILCIRCTSTPLKDLRRLSDPLAGDGASRLIVTCVTLTKIYMSSPDVTQAEEDAIVAALRSGWVAPLGPDVDAFEAEIAAKSGVQHAVALASGTAALHLGMLEVGVKPGTRVISSTMTFAATANAITYTGAEPVFVDCLPETGNLNPELLRRALEQAHSDGATVSAVVPVDLLGQACDYSAIVPLCEEFGVPLVEDAAEALGATHSGRPAGSFGTCAALSFNGNKIMTTSGGGMLLTDSETLAARARYLSTQARQPAVHYEHTEIGYNYRMSNLLAALGRAQLRRLDEMIARRKAMRDRYKAIFASVPGVTVFQGDSDAHDNYWLTSIVIGDDAAFTPAQLAAHLGGDNIESRPLWKPMHLQPVFAGAAAVVDGTSERLFAQGLTLPSGSALGDEEIGRVTTRLAQFLEQHV